MDVDLTQNILRLWNDSHGRNGFAAYVLCCILGQIGNAAWLWLKREIPCVADRFVSDPRATIVSIITNIAGVASIAMLIPFESTPLQAAMIMGFLQGVSSDSVVNKNTRAAWTDEEREKKKNGKRTIP